MILRLNRDIIDSIERRDNIDVTMAHEYSFNGAYYHRFFYAVRWRFYSYFVSKRIINNANRAFFWTLSGNSAKCCVLIWCCLKLQHIYRRQQTFICIFRIEFCGKIGLQPVRTTNTCTPHHPKKSITYSLSTPITYALSKNNFNVKFNFKLPFFKKPKISNSYTRKNKMFKKFNRKYIVSVKLKKNKNWYTPWDMLHGCCQVGDKLYMNIYG